jgi:hypothetical protein
MTDQVRTKAVVTVTEMATMLSLSRARFYQLVAAGVFPPPVYSVSNRRPIYVEDLQEICLEVRRRNCGINGQPVLFYAKGHLQTGKTKTATVATQKPKSKGRCDDVLDGLRTLGLTAVTSEQVVTAVTQLYPAGLDGVDRGQVIRAVFLHLKRRDTADIVGR